MKIVFQSPWNLLFLFALPVMVVLHFYFLRRAKKKALKFANLKVLKRVTGENFVTKRYTVLVLRVFLVLFAVLAVSQPVVWYTGAGGGFDYVFAVDVSSSMSSENGEGVSRLELAKNTTRDFIEGLNSGTSVSLITFSGYNYVEEAVSEDHSELKNSVESLTVRSTGGSDIPGAVISGSSLLSTSEDKRALILITDGSSTVEQVNSTSPLREAVEYAKEKNVVVHSLGIKNTNGTLGYLPGTYNISPLYNENNLKMVSSETGGEYFSVTSQEDYEDAFRRIVSEKEGFIKKEIASYLLLVALFMIFVEWILVNTRYRGIP